MVPPAIPLGHLIDDRYQPGAPVAEAVEHDLVYGEDVVLDVPVMVEMRSARPPDLERVRYRAAWQVDLSGRASSRHRLRALASGQVLGRIFVVHEAYDGVPLEQRLREGMLTVEDAAALVSDVARGLFPIHTLGLAHSPFTPACVVMAQERGEVVAKVAFFDHRAPLSQFRRGPYSPPELCDSRELPAPEHDIYALAMMAYRAVTGSLPRIFDSEPTGESVVPRAPGAISLAEATSGRPLLADWFARALATDPERRFASVMEAASSFVASIAPMSHSRREEGSFNVSLPSAPRSFTPVGVETVRHKPD